MMNLNWTDIELQIKSLDEHIQRCASTEAIAIYGVPKNGLIVALLLQSCNKRYVIMDTPEYASFIVDDLIDSGRTRDKYKKDYPETPFVVLYRKDTDAWISFPWEKPASEDIAETVTRQLEYLGEDCKRDGLLDTPKRVVKSWDKLYGGYSEDPEKILSVTFDQEYDEMVLLKDIELYSTCEHHMLPFFGKCHIAYVPEKKVVGISKLARLMECFSRRLQIQERLGRQIVSAIKENLKPKGVACIIEAQHFCMTSRGVEKQKSIMVTSALDGVFKEDPKAREELMRLIGR